MTGVAKCRVYRIVGPALILAYALVAITAHKYRGRELFPFFNWSLFSVASNPERDIVLVVCSLNGVPLDQPRLFYAMPDTFSAAAIRTSRVAKSLDRWANALARGHEYEAVNMRRLVEGTYMREARSAKYDLAIIIYDPIERLKTGEIRETRIIATYEKRDD